MLDALWTTLESTPLAARIGESWWFPLLESIHVLTAMFVVATVMLVDLRLLGWGAMSYPLQRFSRELLKWTWGSFALAVASGAGMFITRASWYVANIAFQWKLALLALAAVNMALFHFLTAREASQWEMQQPVARVRYAGAMSLVIWIGVTLAGRWTGHLS